MADIPESRTETQLVELSSFFTIPPTLEAASYQLDPIVYQVWPDGQFANDWLINTTNPEAMMVDLQSSPTFAFIDFYATAVVKVKHSEAIGGEGKSEVLTGNRVKIGDRQYAADRSETGLMLLTEAAILDEGNLRPYMATWLGALVTNGRTSGIVPRALADLV